MDTMDVVQLFKSVIDHRTEDVPHLLRRFDQLYSKSKPCWSLSEREIEDFSGLAVEAYFKSLRTAKLIKACDKAFKSFPAVFDKIIQDAIQTRFVELFDKECSTSNFENIISINTLMDLHKGVKVKAQGMFTEFTRLLSEVLWQAGSQDDQQELADPKSLCTVAKLVVKVLQMFPSLVHTELSALKLHTMSGGTGHWGGILTCLLFISTNYDDQDVLLLTGTALAMMLKLLPDQHKKHADVCSILTALTQVTDESHQPSHIKLTSLLPSGKPLTFPINTRGREHSTPRAVRLMAFIKGILVSHDPTALTSGNPPLLVVVFPYICSLCLGDSVHHYLAFQLLSQWYQKMLSCDPNLISASSLHTIMDTMTHIKHEAEKGDKQVEPKTEKDDNLSPLLDSNSEGISVCSYSNQSTAGSSSHLPVLSERECSRDGDLSQQNEASFMSDFCPILNLTLKCVSLNWDGPVDGVTEYVSEIFKDVLTLWHRCTHQNDTGQGHCVSSDISDKNKQFGENQSSQCNTETSDRNNSSQCETNKNSSCQLKTITSEDEHNLTQRLIQQVMGLAWDSKARYRPLRILLPYVDCSNLIETFQQFQKELLRGMGVHIIAAVVTDVYSAFLQQIIVCVNEKEKSSLKTSPIVMYDSNKSYDTNRSNNYIQVWSSAWKSILLQGLLSDDSILRNKVSAYWLPSTVKIIKGSERVILQELEAMMRNESCGDNKRYLFAWTNVAQMCRDTLHSCAHLNDSVFLHKALCSADDDTRASAITLVCSTVRRSEPMTELEASLIKQFLSNNLKTDSSSFRQSLVGSVRKMVVRVRDNCLAACKDRQMKDTLKEDLKKVNNKQDSLDKAKQNEMKMAKRKSDENTLTQGVEWLDWIYKLLMSNLTPGVTFHRRQTTLDLLGAIIEPLVYDGKAVARKGFAPASSQILLDEAHSRGLCMFWSKDNLATLLTCLEDGAEDIQRQTFDLLLRFFKPTFCQLLSDRLPLQHLLSYAMERLSSPRAYSNHSGLMVMSLILHCGVMEHQGSRANICLGHDPLRPLCVTVVSSGNDTDNSSASNSSVLMFIKMLTDQVSLCLSTVQQDLSSGFKVYSVHGLTRCVTKSLQDVVREFHVLEPRALWASRLIEIIKVNERIIDTAMDIMSGGKTVSDCPSYAESEMGIALEKMVSGGEDQEEEEEEVCAMRPEFQLLLSWCWINLRESCTCLGELVRISLLEDECLLPFSVVEDVTQIYIKVLTQCRHRGAIEGCRSGFSMFCCSLFSSKSSRLREIPTRILSKVLADITDQSKMATVTRRSAGLPIIVQLVVQAAKKTNHTSVLFSAVNQLLTIASQPVSTDHSQHIDLGQGHALNILKVIFSDSSLSAPLLPFMSQVTELVIGGFDSPSWAIRNAATQLISTLMTRMFGQKHKTNPQGGLTLEEFENQFPSLLSHISARLNTCHDVSVCVSASLYIILTHLSSLGMSPSPLHTCQLRQSLTQDVCKFLASPVFWLRKLSAKALVALSPLDKTESTLKGFVSGLKTQSTNQMHGYLLAIQSLIATGNLKPAELKLVLVEMMTNVSLLNVSQTCLPLAGLCLDIVSLSVELLGEADEHLDQNITCNVWMFAKMSLRQREDKQDCKNKPINYQPCCKTALSMMVSLVHYSKQNTPSLKNKDEYAEYIKKYDDLALTLTSALTSGDLDIKTAALESLCERQVMHLMDRRDIQQALLKLITMDTRTPDVEQAGQLLMRLALDNRLILSDLDLASLDMGALKKRWRSRPGIQPVLFGLESILTAHLASLPQDVGQWVSQLMEMTKPEANERVRLSAAQSLNLAGNHVLRQCCEKHRSGMPGSVDVDVVVSTLVQACLALLEDSDTEVRSQAAAFVIGIRSHGEQGSEGKVAPVVHTNLCYQILGSYISRSLTWSCHLTSHLLGLVYTPGRLTEAVDATSRTRCDALFEPETGSLFFEWPMTQVWAYHILKHQPCPVSPEIVIQAAKQANTELRQHKDQLDTSLANCPVLNLTCNARVLSSLLGVRCVNLLFDDLEHVSTQDIDFIWQEQDIYPLLKDSAFLNLLTPLRVDLKLLQY